MRPDDQNNQTPDPQLQGEQLLARKLAFTKTTLFLEDLWLKLWPLFIVLALFIIASLYELWGHLSPLAHRGALLIFALAALAALYPLKSIRWPNQNAALKRLDRGNTLPHQPAQAFQDKLAPELNTNQTRTVWRAFKRNLLTKIKKLNVPKPRPKTPEKDPFALRATLVLLIGLGAFIQSGNISARLSEGFNPPSLLDIKNLRIDAWVTPPSYTDQAPLLIKANTEDKKNQQAGGTAPRNKTTVPENSILTIRLNGKNSERVTLISPQNKQQAKEATKTTVSSKAMGKPTKKTNGQKQTKEFTVKLTQSGTIKLTLEDHQLSRWFFEVQEDIPPIIGLTDYPTRAKSGALKLSYKVVDDYGVISAKAHIKSPMIDGKPPRPDLDEDQKPLGDPPEFSLNLPQIGVKSGKGETFKDLTRHPWAGLEATLYLSATDAGGKTATSPELTFTIPAYKFTKPMAKNLIRFRKQLVIAPYESGLIAQSLYALTAYKRSFAGDLSLYLGVRIAANRLQEAQTREEKTEVAELLYDLARHVEDGDLSRAEQELRTAQEQLRQALQENASEKELQQRIEALREALQKYMQELAKKREKQNQNQNNQAQNNSNTLDQSQLEQMLKTIEELAKSGSKQLAQKMLDQMQNMLENLQTGTPPSNAQQSQTAKNLEKLGKLLRRQQELMDKTFQQKRENQRQRNQSNQQQNTPGSKEQQSPNSERKSAKNPSLAEQQQRLKQQLEDILRQMQQGQNNQSLDNAGKAMERAQKSLEGQNLEDALGEEGQALDQLHKGMEQLSEQMGQSGSGGQRLGGKDPKGNSLTNGMDTSETTDVPEEIDLQRAREILRKIQEKMSNPNRPVQELDYLERLLKRF